MLAIREADVASPAASSRRLTIFVIHPSDMLTDHRPHGDGTVAWGFISELGRRGHRVHVACHRVDLATPPPPNITIHRIDTRRPWGAAHTIEYMVRCRRLFDRLRRTERFDVAHQLNPVFGGISLALLGTGVPIVLGTYVAAWPCDWNGDPYVDQPARRIFKRVVLNMQQRPASALLVTTHAALATRIVDVPSVRARVRWQHHGIDSAAYAPDPEKLDAALDSGRILFLANVGIRKGIYTLLDAFSRVHAKHPFAKLVIAGGGPCLDDVRKRIAAAGLDAAVEVLGNVERSQVAPLLHGSAMFCAPSLGEPYGMSAIEAMAAGLPLVVTASGGLAEVADAEGALFVEPRDVAGLADAILTILEAPERARTMSRHNVRRARDVFDWQTVVDTLEDVYAEVGSHVRTG
jgi:glycosyltransferase involved in cell wall biosynthesis